MDYQPFSDRQVLAHLGAADALQLGEGGEARVYALPRERIARIMRPGASPADAEARKHMLDQIATGKSALLFLTPMVERIEVIGTRVVAIEHLLPGEPVSQLLERTEGSTRRRLLANYLDAAASISEIKLAPGPFGQIMGNAELRAASWGAFTSAHLKRRVEAATPELRGAVAQVAGEPLPEPPSAGLVHLDYFPPNVLVVGERISAVLDFGPSAIIGDTRFDPWGAVAYLDPEISPYARQGDRKQAMDWLTERGLVDGYAPAQRWIAASWAHAVDDANLMAWCRRILLR